MTPDDPLRTFIAMFIRVLASVGLLLSPTVAFASPADFVELDAAQTSVVNAEFDLDADTFYAHRDLFDTKDAPLLRFTVYSAQEDGADKIGSFDAFANSTRGESKKFRLLTAQSWIAATQGLQALRIAEFDVFEVSSAVMWVSDYIEGDEVFRQFQMMRWSGDGQRKCTVVTEARERVASFYEDSIRDALMELIKTCGAAMTNNDITSRD